MNAPSSDYGLWPLVIINSLVFIIFAFSFAKPQSKRDWRTFSAFSAFLVALFVEMYGFPLTIYLLSGWLTSHIPGIDPYSHNAGHLLEDLFGWGGNPHFGPFHLLSCVFLPKRATHNNRKKATYNNTKEATYNSHKKATADIESGSGFCFTNYGLANS